MYLSGSSLSVVHPNLPFLREFPIVLIACVFKGLDEAIYSPYKFTKQISLVSLETRTRVKNLHTRYQEQARG